ncbi:MAG: hypothetical protein KatS3mg095_0749 [Candidatus Parcubacteria bacterium]|nr:MAG: hypothetical protein KatS3mg095_0749 [Candidatus Parcubacteria bacterium]
MPERINGEQQFIKYFEEHPDLSNLKEKEKQLTKEEAHESIRNFIKKLHQEIENLPEIKKEAEIHNQSIEEVDNILTEALRLTLEEGIFEGLKYIAKTKNPFLIDAFHDLLAGHFFQALIKYNKLKVIK